MSIFCPDTPPRRGAPVLAVGDPVIVTPPRRVLPAHFVYQTPQGQVVDEEERERRGPPPVTHPA